MLMKKLTLLFLSLALTVCAYADFNRAGIPDSAEVRRKVVESWLTAPIDTLKTKNPELHENEAQKIFQIRTSEGLDSISVIVAPQSFIEMTVVKGGQSTVLTTAEYPACSPGSWILYRDRQTGKPVKIEVYFNADAGVYIQLYPEGNKTFADMLVYNSFLARGVPLGVPFAKLYTASFEDICRWTAKTLPWNKVSVVPGQYREVLQMVQVIREKLPLMDYAEDACYSAEGQLYSILKNKPFTVTDSEGNSVEPEDNGRLTLSSAGFVKWVADGIIEPYLGKGSDIAAIEQQTVEFSPVGKNGIISQNSNLSFHLDWIRNLASLAMSARTHRDVNWKTGGIDVNIRPFAGELINGKIHKSSGYIEDTGYEVARMKSLLYVLGVTEPAWFYAGAVKRFSKIKPDEFVFDDCLVFFPYFDDNGKFDCIVFTRNQEISLSDFIRMNEDCYIHLERIKTSDFFYPR